MADITILGRARLKMQKLLRLADPERNPSLAEAQSAREMPRQLSKKHGIPLPSDRPIPPRPQPYRVKHGEFRRRRYVVAGFQHYIGSRLKQHIKIGDTVSLKPEPDNKYDPNAVAIYWKGYVIGYVPRSENHVLSRFLRAVGSVTAAVAAVSDYLTGWGAVHIYIY